VARNGAPIHLGLATGWTALATAILVLAVLWCGYWYWRDGSRPRWWVKGPLLVLRLIAIASLFIVLAQPVLRVDEIDLVKPSVAVIVDGSDSMKRTDPTLPPAYAAAEARGEGSVPQSVGAAGRIQRTASLVAHSQLLENLTKRFNVRLLTFATGASSETVPAGYGKAGTKPIKIGPVKTGGDSTQMGGALHRAVDELEGQPVAGALILSDGGSNLGEDPLEAAALARQANLHVSTIGIGDPTPTRDVAIISVLADDVVRLHNTVTVDVALTQRGYAGRSIPISLMRGSELVDRQTVRLAPDGQKQQIRLAFIASKAGKFHYTVSTPVLPREISAANNRRVFDQTVITKPLKVLYIENEPRYEFRYLRNAILRDTSVQFTCVLLSSDGASLGSQSAAQLRSFPTDEKTLFDYDIVVIGDVPRAAFTQSQLDMIRRFVEDRGASLIVVAGDQHMPQEYAGTPLDTVLPVEIASSPDQVITDEPFKWQLTPDGRRSPILQLEDDPARNVQVWQSLPGMYWAAGVARARPGATVLAVHPSRSNTEGPYPLVAVHPFGAGHVFVQLVDSTYLWRKRVGDRYFYRYWGQVFRSLTPRDLPGNSRYVQLNVDRSSYRLGERVTLTARLLNAYYRPIKAGSAVAVVTSAGGAEQKVVLQSVPGSPGLFTAQFQPDRVGSFTASLTSPAESHAKATATFTVENLALELQKPELDEDLLRRVAAAGGGKYYRPDQIGDWIASLPDHVLRVKSEKEYELWTAPLLLGLFIVPLALEWLIRRRSGML
jgi:hypothetical protein